MADIANQYCSITHRQVYFYWPDHIICRSRSFLNFRVTLFSCLTLLHWQKDSTLITLIEVEGNAFSISVDLDLPRSRETLLCFGRWNPRNWETLIVFW